MIVLYDEILSYVDYNKFKEKLDEYGIYSTSRSCHVNAKNVAIKNLKTISEEINQKILLITMKKIVSDEIITKFACYNGIVNEINGNVGIVSLNQQNLKSWSELALHETLHLHGISHCETHGCIMCFCICNGTFRYCLNCSNPCIQIHICDKCRDDINGNRNRS
jgi:hypothetical protein